MTVVNDNARASQNRAPAGRFYKYFFWGFVGFVTIAIVATSPLFVKLHHEKKSVNEAFGVFTTALVSQHYAEAYQVCGSDFRAALPYEQFVLQQRSLQAQFGNLKSIQQAGYDVKGSGTPMFWRATIEADLAFEKKTLRFDFEFHKEEGKWVLFGYKEV